jgi:hypothetical protein
VSAAWREPIHVVADEDVSVPQTVGGWKWLQSHGSIEVSEAGLVVLADVVDTLQRADGDTVHDTVRQLVSRLILLYGLAPQRAEADHLAA